LLQFGFRDDPSYLGLDDISVVPIFPPTLQAAVGLASSVTINWPSVAGVSYQLEYKTNILQATWLNLGPPISGTGSTVSFLDPIGPDSQRFYRVMIQP
jgi:hypothetical protein